MNKLLLTCIFFISTNIMADLVPVYSGENYEKVQPSKYIVKAISKKAKGKISSICTGRFYGADHRSYLAGVVDPDTRILQYLAIKDIDDVNFEINIIKKLTIVSNDFGRVNWDKGLNEKLSGLPKVQCNLFKEMKGYTAKYRADVEGGASKLRFINNNDVACFFVRPFGANSKECYQYSSKNNKFKKVMEWLSVD